MQLNKQDLNQQQKQEEQTETQLYAWGSNASGQLGLQLNDEFFNFPRSNQLGLVITQISCGEEHTAILTNQGQVYTFGSNNYGALGIGSHDYDMIESQPQLVVLNSRAQEVRCGWHHTAVILECGSVFTWGRGDSSQLGNGELNNSVEPIPVKLSRDQNQWIGAVKLDCGARHTTVITTHGYALSMGANEAGQLGVSHRNKVNYPERVQIKDRLISIACGVSHTLFLTQNRKVLASGSNNLLQLGLGHNFKNIATPTQINDLNDIVVIAAGNHSAALNSRGQLYLWGQGAFGSLDKPINFSNGRFFTLLSIGGPSGAAVDEDGALFVWGSNTNGELGMGDQHNRVEPSIVVALQGEIIGDVAMGQGFTIALKRGKRSDPVTVEYNSITHTNNQIAMQMVNSEKDYLTKTLKIEQDERQALERINRDLRNKILDLTEGQDGTSMLKLKLKERDEQCIFLQSRVEEFQNISQQHVDELRDCKTNILGRQQRMQDQYESLQIYESRIKELEDNIRRKNQELEDTQVQAHRIGDEFSQFEKQEQEQLRQFKHQLSDLTIQLQHENELREKLQHTLNRERSNSSALQLWADQNTQKAEELATKNILLSTQLENTLNHHQRLTEALQASNVRVQTLQAQNNKLMQELAMIRTSLYSEIPRDQQSVQPLEVQAVVQLNKQLNEINTTLQGKIREKDQELIKIRQGFNELIERELHRTHGSIQQRAIISQQSQQSLQSQQQQQYEQQQSQQQQSQQAYSVASRQSNKGTILHQSQLPPLVDDFSRHTDRQSENSYTEKHQKNSSQIQKNSERIEHEVYEEQDQFQGSAKGKTISELLESAHKHAKFMKRILKDIDQEEMKQSQQCANIETHSTPSPKKRLFYDKPKQEAKIENSQQSEKLQSSAKRYERQIKEIPENIENEYVRSLSEVKAKLAKLQNNRQQLDQKYSNKDTINYRN